MTDARWCNYGNHPFDGSRKDTRFVGQLEQVPNQWGGQQPSYQPNLKEICGDCSALLGIADVYKAPEPPAERREELVKSLERPGRKQ